MVLLFWFEVLVFLPSFLLFPPSFLPSFLPKNVPPIRASILFLQELLEVLIHLVLGGVGARATTSWHICGFGGAAARVMRLLPSLNFIRFVLRLLRRLFLSLLLRQQKHSSNCRQRKPRCEGLESVLDVDEGPTIPGSGFRGYGGLQDAGPESGAGVYSTVLGVMRQ